jgi:hypothetical protein
MSDHAKLKELAEALNEVSIRYLDNEQDNEVGDEWSAANERYVEASEPAVVLALIADNEKLEPYKIAFMEWLDKTAWVQESVHFTELGQHRADVMRGRINQLAKQSDTFERDLNGMMDLVKSLREDLKIANNACFLSIAENKKLKFEYGELKAECEGLRRKIRIQQRLNESAESIRKEAGDRS